MNVVRMQNNRRFIVYVKKNSSNLTRMILPHIGFKHKFIVYIMIYGNSSYPEKGFRKN